MDRTLKPVCSATIAMALLSVVIAATPASAVPTGIALSSPEIVHGEPCSPTVSLGPIVPGVTTTAIHPVAVVPPQENEGGDDDWDFTVECEGAISVSAKADDGQILVKTCSRDGPVGCTLSNGDASFEITLEGCITVAHDARH